MAQKIQKFTVDVTKKDAMKSTYYVLALSAGGAENAVFDSVYNAEFALAILGWPVGVKLPDLVSHGAGIQAAVATL